MGVYIPLKEISPSNILLFCWIALDKIIPMLNAGSWALGIHTPVTQNNFLLFGDLWPIFLFYTEMFWKRHRSDFLQFLLALTGETEENALGVVTS